MKLSKSVFGSDVRGTVSEHKLSYKATLTLESLVDLLQSAYVLLGTSIFDRFAKLALEALKNQAWLELEAALFCLNALAESISGDEVVDATLSTLFGSELFPTMTNNALEIPSKTQQTAVTIIINFTAFFERHTQYLPSMLTFLFDSARTPALAEVAAKAVQSTCDSCRQSLVSEIGAFLQQYDNLLLWEDLATGAKERITGAIAAIIQAIPSKDEQMESLSRLVGFVEQDVQACFEFAESNAPVGAEEKGLCALSCLISMGKFLEEPDDKTIDLESKPAGQDELYVTTIWTPFQQRIVHSMNAVANALGPNNGAVVEAICQVFRTGFKEKFPGPFVFAPNVIEDYVTSTNLQTPRLDYALATAGAMLSAHSRAGATTTDRSATRFLIHLFQLTAAMGYNPTTEPEVASSCLDLATKYIPHYLHTFLDPQSRNHISNFIRFINQSMLCPELMPRRSAAFFWACLVQRYDVKTDVQVMVDSILELYGPQITQAIINNIGGEASRSELDSFAEPLRQMASAQASARQWLSNALSSSAFPSRKVGAAEKRVFLQQVLK
ncbi:MAG: hypothetical protein L6R40_001663 [Gallowayella cf. fulva]|nr:MAG: hypothetical protein L6R40_001663 [Xanthomendoza cf. fulva]